jgi:hypothetical protein
MNWVDHRLKMIARRRAAKFSTRWLGKIRAVSVLRELTRRPGCQGVAEAITDGNIG